MDLRTQFHYIVEVLDKKYGLTSKKLNDYVYDVFEGPIPVCQIIHGRHQNPQMDKVLLSMHIDVDPAEAIQWYLRVKDIHPGLYLTASHFKDDYGETYMGQSAYTLKNYKEQQKIISQWQKDKEDTKKFTESKISGRVREPRRFGYLEKADAVKEFEKMQKEDKDKCH